MRKTQQTKVQTSVFNLQPDDRVEPIYEGLKVTGIQVYPLREPMGKTRAMVRVVIEDQLQLTGMRIVDGSNGLFVGYPNDPSYKGDDFRSLFYPVTKDLRDHIESVVLKRYKEILA